MPPIVEMLLENVSCTRNESLAVNPLILFSAIALPHFLYAFIWFYPDKWMKMFPKNPVDAFAAAGAIGKLIQFTAILCWFSSIRDRGLCLDLHSISLLQFLAALVLICYGQSLNFGIFRAIGHDGVYYGSKLGRKIPWVTGWPFDTVSHPQYVGSVLTIWALVVVVWGQAPGTPLLTVAGFWTLVYAATAVQEQFLTV